MSYLHNILTIILIVIHLSSFSESKKLKLVLVVHRHGDRSPIFTFPTDPYKDEEKYWPDHFEMLTIEGKQRMYLLGKYMRKRYKSFLSGSPREIYVRSSAKDRCLESGRLVLAGLCPPEGRWKWNDDLGQLWQPFPINTEDLSKDGMLNPNSICPKADSDLKLIVKSKQVKDFFKKHEKLVEFIAQKSGVVFDHFNIGRDMFNTFEIQKQHKYKLPDWVNDTVYHCLEEFHEMAFYFYFSSHTQLRLRTGVLLKDIAHRMKESIADKNSTQKLFIYSTHDTQLSALLFALNLYNERSPPFGATLFIELYEMKRHDNIVHRLEVHYLNVTESEKTYELSSKKFCNGKKICLLDEFLISINDLIPDDWYMECKEVKSFVRKYLFEL